MQSSCREVSVLCICPDRRTKERTLAMTTLTMMTSIQRVFGWRVKREQGNSVCWCRWRDGSPPKERTSAEKVLQTEPRETKRKKETRLITMPHPYEWVREANARMTLKRKKFIPPFPLCVCVLLFLHRSWRRDSSTSYSSFFPRRDEDAFSYRRRMISRLSVSKSFPSFFFPNKTFLSLSDDDILRFDCFPFNRPRLLQLSFPRERKRETDKISLSLLPSFLSPLLLVFLLSSFPFSHLMPKVWHEPTVIGCCGSDRIGSKSDLWHHRQSFVYLCQGKRVKLHCRSR